MDTTMVKNPANRRTRKVNPKGKKNDGSRRKCRVCGKAGHNQRTCPKLGRKKKMSVRSPGVGRGKGTRRCSKCGKKGHNRATCGSSSAKTSSTRRKNFRRMHPTISTAERYMKKPIHRLSAIGDTKIAKKADSEIAPMAHGAQKWVDSSMGQKAVQVAGGFTGYGYGGYFTQTGQDMSENVLLGTGAGLITGVGGLAATSWTVNTFFGNMLFKKHEEKHHTFANFTKGWKYGGYIGVGLNTITNLLTMYYGRNYSGLSGWNGIMSEMKYDTVSALKKAAMMSTGAHKLSHIIGHPTDEDLI